MSVASKPTVVAVSGVKNSGKTTLITAMLPHFHRAGVQVAVIKHDGHTFQPEPPNTDTGRYLQAGGLGAAIYDGETTKVIWRQTPDLPGLLELFPQADLILLEGGSTAPGPSWSWCGRATLPSRCVTLQLCWPWSRIPRYTYRGYPPCPSTTRQGWRTF